MTIPYTYLLKCKATGELYYGVKYAKNCNPDQFWKTYFTSSEYVKQLIHKYGINQFEFQIRKTFECESKARAWERKVIKRMNIANRREFINRSCPGEYFGFETGEKNPMSDPKIKQKMIINRTKSLLKNHGVSHNSKIKSFRDNASLTMSKTNSTIVACPHCGKKGGHINMKRYHYNNCKEFKRSNFS
jgi:hypothetical protein